jgi:2-oxoglutarate ferredoxin oxidoreductase subunit beta
LGSTRVSDALDIEQFLHTERLPHIWCPGCGIGMVTGAFLRAAVDLGLKREKTVVVGGIGCSSRAVGYIDLGTVHAIHGRALAFATGIKMARPDFTVVVLTGDGDGAAIGGNHLIHACRRNIDITCILFNNQTYGMTGGQVSPTTDPGDRATTAPYGQLEPSFDLCRLAQAAGASFVARGTAASIRPLERLIKQGIQHRGFSFVEAVVPCPTEFGKRNPPAGVVAMLDDAKARSVSITQAAKMSPQELEGKIVTGVLYEDSEAPEFQQTYAAISAVAQEAATAARKGRPRRGAPPPAAEPAAACGLPADLLAKLPTTEETPAPTAPGFEPPSVSAVRDKGLPSAAVADESAGAARKTSEDVGRAAPRIEPERPAPGTTAVLPGGSEGGSPRSRRRGRKDRVSPVADAEPPDTVGLPCEGGE